MALTARRTGIKQLDALIVDEGQDLFDMASLETMDRFLKGGIAKGRWAIFHDSNNQSGFFTPPDPPAMAWLNACGPARVPLTVNCRNTLTILNKIKCRLGADMGIRGAGKGPEVRETTVSSRSESAQCLAHEIERLLGPGQFPLGSITLLSPLGFPESSASRLPSKLKEKITLLDPWSMRSFPLQTMSFARIHEFKGLENEAVLVTDLPSFQPGIKTTNQGWSDRRQGRCVF